MTTIDASRSSNKQGWATAFVIALCVKFKGRPTHLA